MKPTATLYRRCQLSSFTLVELLVVIAIIAILASLILYAGTTAINAAKRTKAANTATQIQTAALGYYTEYSVYPVPSGTTSDYFIADTASSATAWGNLIYSLCGNIQPYAPTTSFTTNSLYYPSNTRNIAFLSMRGTDVDANNAPLNPLPTGSGSSAEVYFNIGIDSDYNGIISTNSSGTSVLPNFATATNLYLSPTGGSSTAGVAVWANCTGKTTITNAAWWVHTY